MKTGSKPGTKSKSKYKPFWNATCTKLSENLFALPNTGLDPKHNPFIDLNDYKKRLDAKINAVGNETNLKTVMLRLNTTDEQVKTLNKWFDTANHVYNKAIECIESRGKGDSISKFSVRNKLVTDDTITLTPVYFALEKEISDIRKLRNKLDKENVNELKWHTYYTNKIAALSASKKAIKPEKNPNVQSWELETPKDIRLGEVFSACSAYKTGFTQIKNKTITHFKMAYRKKTRHYKSITVPKVFIKIVDSKFSIYGSYFSSKINGLFSVGKYALKDVKELVISHDCEIVKKRDEYWLHVPVKVETSNKPVKYDTYCGIDPGVRTAITTFGNNGFIEIEHDINKLTSLNRKINALKQRRMGPLLRGKRTRTRRRNIAKYEKRKNNYITNFHWHTIKTLLSNNDCIFYGDIKSHDIVKDGINATLNRDLNDLKFYQFKQRLLFKAKCLNKTVFEVDEPYTTKTCSFCGELNDPGTSKIYECSKCNRSIGRDINAAKNILIKGILENLLTPKTK